MRLLPSKTAAAAFGIMGLVALLTGIGHAQARVLYCAPDSEASNLDGGINEFIAGKHTKMYRDTYVPSGAAKEIWRGQTQMCDLSAGAEGCVFRVDHGESKSYSILVGFDAGFVPGGANKFPAFPMGMFNFKTETTKTTTFNVANQTSATPGEYKVPVIQVQYIYVTGHYTGAYRHVAETPGCHGYTLDPNAEFGRWTATVAGDEISTWVKTTPLANIGNGGNPSAA